MESLYDYFVKGGVTMWPLLLCSILSLTFILERSAYWMRQREDEAALLEAVRRGADLPPQQGPLRSIAQTALAQQHRSREEMREVMEVAAISSLQEAERYGVVLRTVAEVAPLLGFLGTVTGMIRAFNAVAVAGLGNPEVVANGIAEALITTATGLMIAIPTYVAYSIFAARVDRLAGQLERMGTHLLEILQRGSPA